MSFQFGFATPADVRARVPGCPMAQTPPGAALDACTRCPYNLVAPGTPRVGCVAKVPADVIGRAKQALETQPADVVDVLRPLLSLETVIAPGDPRLDKVLTACAMWLTAIVDQNGMPLDTLLERGSDSARASAEVAMWCARLAKAGQSTRCPVRFAG